MNLEKLKTVAEYAAMIGVSPTTVYNRIEQGKYKTVKIGKILLVIIE